MTNEDFLPNEQWKEYQDDAWHESYRYLISNYGRMKALKVSKHYNKEIKGSLTHGYVTLTGRTPDGKSRNRYLHKIVAELFVQKQAGKDYVIHLDYDKTNNRAYNLKWVSNEEKNKHMGEARRQRLGNVYSKLTETQVIRLKKILLDPNRKTRYKILARQFGVSEMQLHRIKTGENWGHIKV